MSATSELPKSSIPIFTTLASYREWRRRAHDEKKSVGFVATMGALHEGHISLGVFLPVATRGKNCLMIHRRLVGSVRRSLAENDLTAVSIFVNPAQFSPTEDLATYPRTLEHDLKVLEATKHLDTPTLSTPRITAALFLPSVHEMYPSGITQDTSLQTGTFVEVKGYGHQMEGSRRPDFFRGVATIVTKLFNAIEPTRTYFGQKDIQQALLLRRMVRDLLLSHPSPENLYIVPTSRDLVTSLALSSRNAYLSETERQLSAPTLFAALQEAKRSWEAGSAKEDCVARAYGLVQQKVRELSASENNIQMRLDYLEFNDPDTFELVPGPTTREQYLGDGAESRPVILSGAMWVGKTRLIDNIVLGDVKRLGIVDA